MRRVQTCVLGAMSSAMVEEHARKRCTVRSDSAGIQLELH